MSKNEFNKLSDLELLLIIKNTNDSNVDYHYACEILLNRYLKQIHKHWWILQKQMNDIDLVKSMKEDFYDEAYEAFFIAIQKTDVSKIENDKWKFVGMLNWYLTNVRKKLRRIMKKESVVKHMHNMSCEENENSNEIDVDVEEAYQINDGYKNDPAYQYELSESENNCKKSIENCLKLWTEKERIIYKLLLIKSSL